MKHIKTYKEQEAEEYKNLKYEEKVIFNIFLCYHEENNLEKWKNCIQKFKDLNINWWVEPNAGHHLGLAYQSILDVSDIKEAEEISKDIMKIFDNDALIVISKQMVHNYEPVGRNNEKAFHECGRYFDKLVSQNKKGLFII